MKNSRTAIILLLFAVLYASACAGSPRRPAMIYPANYCATLAVHEIQLASEHFEPNTKMGALHDALQFIPMGDALAVHSFPAEETLPNRTWTYDQALALLWLTASADHRRHEVAQALLRTQHSSGVWSFAWDSRSGEQLAPHRAGATAWAAWALFVYGCTNNSLEAIRTARRTALYFAANASRTSRRHPRVWIPSTPSLEVLVTEHQISAMPLLERFNPPHARLLAREMENLLPLEREPHFWRTSFFGEPDGDDLALDAAGSWAALWLQSRGQYEKSSLMLKHIMRTFHVNDTQSSGLRPWAPQVDSPSRQSASLPLSLIWTEGTMGMAFALWRQGQHFAAESIVDSLGDLLVPGPNGLLRDTNLRAAPFLGNEAAAPTLWYLLWRHETLFPNAQIIFPPI